MVRENVVRTGAERTDTVTSGVRSLGSVARRESERAGPRMVNAGDLSPAPAVTDRDLDGRADLAQDRADLAAEEDQGDDRDDRDQGEDQCVLGQALALLVAADRGEERVDERHFGESPEMIAVPAAGHAECSCSERRGATDRRSQR